ncbi:MAG: hypothetical protein RR248_05980 [Clostridia bacterium]
MKPKLIQTLVCLVLSTIMLFTAFAGILPDTVNAIKTAINLIKETTSASANPPASLDDIDTSRLPRPKPGEATSSGNIQVDLLSKDSMSPDITITNDTYYPWIVDGSYNGNVAYKSTMKTNALSSAITFKFTSSQDGALYFDNKIASGEHGDYLKIMLNGVEAKISGYFNNKQDWKTSYIPFKASSAEQTIHIIYAKDSVDGNFTPPNPNEIWIANVGLAFGQATITLQTNQMDNSNFTVSSVVLGNAPGAVVASNKVTATVPFGTKFFADYDNKDSAKYKSAGWYDESGNKIANGSSYITATKTATYTFRFEKYVEIDPIGLTYKSGSKVESIIKNETTLIINADENKDFSLDLSPNIARGNTVKILHNNVEKTITNGKYTFPSLLSGNDEIVVTISKTGFYEKTIKITLQSSLVSFLSKSLGVGVAVDHKNTPPWIIKQIEGKFALKSNYIEGGGDKTICSIAFTAQTDGVLSFLYKSKQDYGSMCSATINNAPIAINGNNVWTSVSIPVTKGEKYTLEFTSEIYSWYSPDFYIIDLIILPTSEYPDISLQYQDGDNGALSNANKILSNGVDQNFASLVHDGVNNSTRKYIFNLTNTISGYSYYALVNGKRIDATNNTITIENIDGKSTVDIYVVKAGAPVKVVSYVIDYTCDDISEIINVNDVDKFTSIVNDPTNPWGLDSAKSAERGNKVFKSNTQYLAGTETSISFNVTAPSDGMYTLDIDFLVSSLYSDASYESWYVTIDGVYVTGGDDRTWGDSNAEWETMSLRLIPGTNVVKITFYRYERTPNDGISTLWLSNLRIREYKYPTEIKVTREEGAVIEEFPSLIKGGAVQKLDTTVYPLKPEFIANLNKDYVISVSGLLTGNRIYAVCGGATYYAKGDIITIPSKAVNGNIYIWYELSKDNVWYVTYIPITVSYSLSALITDGTPVTVTADPMVEETFFGKKEAIQSIQYEPTDTAIQGYPVYTLNNDANRPDSPYTAAIRIHIDYTFDTDTLFSLWAMQNYQIKEYPYGGKNYFGTLNLLIDDKFHSDITETVVADKTKWKQHFAVLPSGQHRLTIEFSITYVGSISSNCNNLKLGNLQFTPIPTTGNGSEVTPFKTVGVDTILAKGINYLQNINMPANTEEVFLQYVNKDNANIVTGVTATAPVIAVVTNGIIKVSNVQQTTTVTVTTTANKEFTVKLNKAGFADKTITGSGSKADPYIISTAEHLTLLNANNTSYFKFKTANATVTLPGNWTPIGNEALSFSGGLDGNGVTINGLSITSGNNVGLFGYVRNATIQNITLNATVKGSGNVGALVGNALFDTNIINCRVNATVSGANNVGGIIGFAKEKINITNCSFTGSVSGASTIGGLVGLSNVGGLTATNCTVGKDPATLGNDAQTRIIGTNSNIGGLSGNGGDYVSCTTYADVVGKYVVGGLVGGYDNNSKFDNTYMAGSVAIEGDHANNYPYFGSLTGYGAWVTYTLNDSGMLVTLKYASSVAVSAIDIFNHDDALEVVTGLVAGSTSGTVKYKIKFKKINAAIDLLSETLANGIPGNYGGVTIRFTMADGTYKYTSTLDRAELKFKTNFDLNLDNLTSYKDNFSTIEIDKSIGTRSHYTETVNNQAISIFGTALIDNANDFEHLSWIVNGAIPTTFAGGLYYNCRSVVTISIKLTNDINLTADRIVGEKCLNRVGGNKTGDKLNQFTGFATSEMNPYRGSIYGNNHSITVNMDFPNAYLLGIINLSSDKDYDNVISNLTVYGTINGGYRVGIVGSNDRYWRSGCASFINVKNYATITAKGQAGGLIGYSNTGTSLAIKISNCVNYGSVTLRGNGTRVGGFVGDTTTNVGSSVEIANSSNFGTIRGFGTVGGLVGSNKANCFVAITNCSNFGDIISTTTNIGGFVGTVGELRLEGNNKNYGCVSGGSYVGGIAGNVAILKSLATTINYGNVIGSGSNVGGLYGVVAELTQTGTDINLGYVAGTSTATNGVGGIVGSLTSGTITNAINYGDVLDKAATIAGAMTGGIVGYTSTATINNCFNYGKIIGVAPKQILGGVTQPTGNNESGTVVIKQ